MTRIACVVAGLVASGALSGCAFTKIDRSPDGSFSYLSTRDSSLDELHLVKSPDGSIELDVNGAAGQASPVVAAQADVLRAFFEAAFAAGARATVNR